jgi:hypothetical protein
MYSMTLMSFDSRDYQLTTSSSPSKEALFEIHRMIIEKFSAFQLNPSRPEDLLSEKEFPTPMDRWALVKNMVTYFELLRTLPEEDQKQISSFFQVPEGGGEQGGHASAGIPVFAPKAVSKEYFLGPAEMTFVEALREQLKQKGHQKESSYEVIALFFGLPHSLNTFMPVNVMISESKSSSTSSSSDQDDKKEVKAMIEIYGHNTPFPTDRNQQQKQLYSRFELLKVHFYSHYYPEIPFFRLRLSDIAEKPKDVVSLLLAQLR